MSANNADIKNTTNQKLIMVQNKLYFENMFNKIPLLRKNSIIYKILPVKFTLYKVDMLGTLTC